MKSFNELTIRSQVLYSFLILSIICFGVLTSVAIANIFIMGANSTNIMSSSLTTQIERNMELSTEANSQVIQKKFDNTGVAISGFAEAVEQLFQDDYNFGVASNYRDLNVSTMPGAHYNDTYKQVISFDSTVYFVTGTTTQTDYDNAITANMQNIINRSVNLDNIIKSIYFSHPDFTWVYVGFGPTTASDVSVHRKYPAATLLNRNFDPTVRPWYIGAINAGKDNYFISDPFLDANGQGWIISISKAVIVNNQVIGVVSADMKIATIQEKVLNVSFLKTGYATMMNLEGTVISHPEWQSEFSSSAPDITDFEPWITDMIKQELTSPAPGVISVEKDNKPYLVSHNLILNEFIYLTIVPKEEAIEVVPLIQSEVANVQVITTLLTITLSVITILVIIVAGLMISSRISKPVQNLTDIALQITKNATEKDIMKGVSFDTTLTQQDEIGNLTKSFSDMVSKLRDEQTKK